MFNPIKISFDTKQLAEKWLREMSRKKVNVKDIAFNLEADIEYRTNIKLIVLEMFDEHGKIQRISLTTKLAPDSLFIELDEVDSYKNRLKDFLNRWGATHVNPSPEVDLAQEIIDLIKYHYVLDSNIENISLFENVFCLIDNNFRDGRIKKLVNQLTNEINTKYPDQFEVRMDATRNTLTFDSEHVVSITYYPIENMPTFVINGQSPFNTLGKKWSTYTVEINDNDEEVINHCLNVFDDIIKEYSWL